MSSELLDLINHDIPELPFSLFLAYGKISPLWDYSSNSAPYRTNV
jgi:hypothetical protein